MFCIVRPSNNYQNSRGFYKNHSFYEAALETVRSRKQSMNSKEATRASQKLSWLLRHGANEAHVTMDTAGWCSIEHVLRYIGMTRDDLDAIVRDNTKSRLEVRNNQIRACQGHSLMGTPVTLEALEASWVPDLRDTLIWHGTSIGALESIAREGLLAGDRTHVHLASETDSKVGKRAGVDVLLGIDTIKLRSTGISLYRSPNGVLLARSVSHECIAQLQALSRSALADESALRRLFHLS
jgi:putative RNA 2'-phosphotransferase